MGKLVIERYKQWVASLPVSERKTPYIVRMVDGEEKMFSPEDVLREMEANTKLGQEFQAAEEKLMLKLEERKARFYR